MTAATAGADLAQGYAAAREGAGLAGIPGRALLAVTGPLRAKFLHGVLSNDVQSLSPGAGRSAALMDVKGRQLVWMRVLVEADAVLLETGSDRLPLLEEQLIRYRVAAPVRFARREIAVMAVLGPRAKDVLRAAGAEAPSAAANAHVATALAGHAVRVVRASDLPAGGLAVHVDPPHVEAVARALEAAGAVTIPPAVLDALRVEDGRPWYGADVAEDNLLHETGLLAEYHSPSKGCYVGQEVVARLEGRGGNVNKLLRGLRLSAPASTGDAVLADGREVGRVTTPAVSPREGPIAMAYVHRAHAEPGTAVTVGGAPATVVALPFNAPAAGA